MAEAALMGWDADAQVWRKLVCNAAGKLIIDPTEIFEDPPTEDEHGKAPASSWAFDHEANVSAHHTRYTDAESRAAIGNLLDSTGKIIKALDCGYQAINFPGTIRKKASSGDNSYIDIMKTVNYDALRLYCYKSGVGYVQVSIELSNGTAYEKVATEVIVDSKILTHKNIADAHHTRYTDAEAVAAVGYNGTKYWSCGGINFHGENPATDNIILSSYGNLFIAADGIALLAPVSLPHGATITNVIVTGNAGASAESWTLYRCLLSGGSPGAMAGANINTADSTITSPAIDNSTYCYYFYTSTLDTNDEVWGAIIEYTL